MSVSDSRSYIYYPESLGELLQLYARKPRATIYAGGTFLLKSQAGSNITLPREVISLQRVEDLARIGRSERYLEIGAATNIASILRVGGRVLPPVIREGLESITPPALTSIATLGGNLCVSQYALSCVALAQLLDLRLELRHQDGSRWVAAGRFRGQDGALAFRAGELLTRIRIPLETWNVHMFRKFGRLYHPDTHPLVVAAVAQSSRGTLDDLRVTVSSHGPNVIRSKELEAELVGRKVPLGRREIEGFMRGITKLIDQPGRRFSSLQRHRTVGLVRGFLSSLIDSSA